MNKKLEGFVIDFCVWLREVLIIGLSISLIILFCLIMTGHAHAYSTQETIAFNKLFTNDNLSNDDELIILTYLEPQNMANETLLIEETREDLEEIIDEMNESIYEELDLFELEIESLKKNISNINPENDELAILEKKKELLLITLDEKESEKEDPFDILLAKYMGEDDEKTSSIQNSSYITDKEKLRKEVKKIFRDVKYDEDEEELYFETSKSKDYDEEIEDLKTINQYQWGAFLLLIFAYWFFNKDKKVNSSYEGSTPDDVIEQSPKNLTEKKEEEKTKLG